MHNKITFSTLEMLLMYLIMQKTADFNKEANIVIKERTTSKFSHMYF